MMFAKKMLWMVVLLLVMAAQMNITDAVTVDSLPMITGVKSPYVTKKINKRLAYEASVRRCEHKSTAHYWHTQATVTYRRHDVYSIRIEDKYYCGGPYPSEVVSSVNFSLISGGIIGFDTLFKSYNKNQQQIMSEAIKYNQPLSIAKACPHYTSQYILRQGFTYFFSKKGIVIVPQFPHVIAACSVPLTVPYAALKSYSKLDGVIQRILAADRG